MTTPRVPMGQRSPAMAAVRSHFQLSKETRKVNQITIRFEGIPEPEMEDLVTFVDYAQMFAPTLADDSEELKKWFGRAFPTARTRLRVVSAYLKNRCTGITFVRKLDKSVCCNSRVNILDFAMVIPTKLTGGLTVDALRTEGGEVHVPTGLRIFLGPLYFNSTEIVKIATVFHELTHKVIKTVDHANGYGVKPCQALKDDSPVMAAENADNYGYSLAFFVKKTMGL
jgi:hypothetical protein